MWCKIGNACGTIVPILAALPHGCCLQGAGDTEVARGDGDLIVTPSMTSPVTPASITNTQPASSPNLEDATGGSTFKRPMSRMSRRSVSRPETPGSTLESQKNVVNASRGNERSRRLNGEYYALHIVDGNCGTRFKTAVESWWQEFARPYEKKVGEANKEVSHTEAEMRCCMRMLQRARCFALSVRDASFNAWRASHEKWVAQGRDVEDDYGALLGDVYMRRVGEECKEGCVLLVLKQGHHNLDSGVLAFLNSVTDVKTVMRKILCRLKVMHAYGLANCYTTTEIVSWPGMNGEIKVTLLPSTAYIHKATKEAQMADVRELAVFFNEMLRKFDGKPCDDTIRAGQDLVQKMHQGTTAESCLTHRFLAV